MSRILLVTSVLPWPLRRNGGGQRTEMLRAALARHGRVDIVAIGGNSLFEGTRPTADELHAASVVATHVLPPIRQSGGRNPITRFKATIQNYTDRYRLDPTAHDCLAKLHQANAYDVVVGRFLAPSLVGGIEKLPVKTKLLDFDDIDWLTLQEQMKHRPWGGLRGKIAAGFVLREVRKICRQSVRQFDRVFVTSKEDADALVSARVTVLPNIPYEPAMSGPLEPDDASRRLLFVGDLQHGPNADGLEWFLVNVWPAVRLAVSDATIQIVGRGISDAQRAAWSAIGGCEVAGFVHDLRDSYRAAAATIAPVFWGGGTKIKVLESLAMGRTMVLSSHALRGYGTLAANAVWVADDIQGFASAAVQALTNPAERAAKSARGLEIVRSQYNYGRFCNLVDAALA